MYCYFRAGGGFVVVVYLLRDGECHEACYPLSREAKTRNSMCRAGQERRKCTVTLPGLT